MNECVLLVNSCDSYDDLWNPFFTLLHLYWPDLPYQIYLNTEHKQYCREDLNIRVLNQISEEEIPWGKRILDCLKRLDCEYVMISLDDFFLRQPVKTEKINNCIRAMDAEKDISVFYFLDTSDVFRHEFIDDGKYPEFELAKKNAHYLMNLQAAVWRKNDLESYIHEFDSPWSFEVLGSRYYKGNHKFYYLKPKSERIFDYGFKMNGMGVFRGQWVKEDVVPLFQKHGIEVDYNKRGFYRANDNVFVDIRNRLRLRLQLRDYEKHYYKNLEQ